MRTLRNIPIKHKLIMIGMLTSGVALLFTCGAFIAYEQLISRTNLVDENLETARLIGYDNTAALSFNDRDAALTSLQAFSHHAAVIAVVIYDKDGKLFAAYRSAATAAFKPPPVEHNTHRFGEQGLELFSDVELDGETIGTVYIHHDLSETYVVQRQYVIIAGLVMLGALLINWLISSRLYRIISEPISHLSTVVEAVTAEKNYSVRAVKRGDDELGGLIDGFNEMLQQIQKRDFALQEAREDLEKRVAERTTELANSLSLLNATLDSTTDGVIAIRTSGEVICSNSQYVTMWGMDCAPPEHQLNTATQAFIGARVKDSEQYFQRIADIKTHPEMDAFDVLELKDGRLFERFVKPQWLAGEIEGQVISFRDITERKRAEQELESIHRQLLDASRQAGMAEVASNVLHNVGNVLNSVNVSTNLLTDTIKGSKISSLRKVVALLQQHEQDLGDFIINNQKGRHFPVFLTQLSEHLLSEQQATIKELESLRNNVDHIKQIVAMQQNYSKVSGIKEITNITDLLEDTLRMNEGALLRHGVRVVRDYDRVSAINTEKHKILQILVNLVRNAKYACSDSGRADKCMVLRVAEDQGWLKVSVSDNGVGIPRENLTRIFGHGFTTRKDGHGFGLHSGALAAQELGGFLRVHSEGAGQGATFTLELPVGVTEEQKCLTA
jgi:PAS domain S-box-containing protein